MFVERFKAIKWETMTRFNILYNFDVCGGVLVSIRTIVYSLYLQCGTAIEFYNFVECIYTYSKRYISRLDYAFHVIQAIHTTCAWFD